MDGHIFSNNKAVAVLFLLSLAQSVVSAAVEDAICNQYYIFDGLSFSDLSPDRVDYSPGDEVKIDYALENKFGSPLVQGDIKALVIYMDPDKTSRPDDGDIVDDFIAKSDVNIQEGEKYAGSFVWKIPQKAKSGYYAVNVYFPVKKKFDISGLSFTTSVPAKKTSFKVSSDAADYFFLDKAATSVNGAKYGFRAPLAEAKPNAPVEIKTRLVNGGAGSIDVSYELFSWNDMEGALTQYGKKETVSGSKDLVYNIPGLSAGVYMARITASSGGWKSILKVRFFVRGGKGGFVWAGLDKFPLERDDKATLILCYTNFASEPGASDVNLPARLALKVSDDKGNIIVDESTQVPALSASVEGKKIGFISPAQETRLTVRASMYDDKGALMDDVELLYDYSKFLNIKKALKLSAPDRAADKITYEVGYADEYNGPLSGDSVVYLSAPDGKVVAIKEGPIAGRLTGEFSLANLADGDYVLTAIEKKDSLTDKKTVSVSRAKEPAPATTVEVVATTVKPVATTIAQQQNQSPTQWLPIIVAVAAIALILLLFKPKPKEAKK